MCSTRADAVYNCRGAAGKAVQLGVPSIAFSGGSGSTAQEAWTDLTTAPTSPTIVAAAEYAALTVAFVSALLAQPPAADLLPAGATLNVNFPATSDACAARSVQWVLTRVFPVLLGHPDVVVCGNGGRLPLEGDVNAAGCFASVSVIDATTKLDVGKDTQSDVLGRLGKLGFVCFPG